MSTSFDIDAFVLGHARRCGAPLVVSQNILIAMKRNAADISGLMRDGCLAVAAPTEVVNVPIVHAVKGSDGIWRDEVGTDG